MESLFVCHDIEYCNSRSFPIIFLNSKIQN